MRLSASCCHIQQCTLDIGSAQAEWVGQGEVGGCTQRVKTALSHLGLAVKVALVLTRWTISQVV